MASEREKMLAGELYRTDAELFELQMRARRLTDRFNATPGEDMARRREILDELCGGGLPRDVVVRSPFHCDYGTNITFGENVFLNFGCVFLDVVRITIGAGTQIGPAVQIYTADHPRDAETRRTGVEFGCPVVIGENVWIGGGAIILPGVTVGDDAVIGAGAVVTRDVAPGATVAGNPARVIAPRR